VFHDSNNGDRSDDSVTNESQYELSYLTLTRAYRHQDRTSPLHSPSCYAETPNQVRCRPIRLHQLYDIQSHDNTCTHMKNLLTWISPSLTVGMVIHDVIDITASKARHTDVASDVMFCSRFSEEYISQRSCSRWESAA
jgi:hypothetical protein